MIINRIYETQNLLSCFILGRAKDLSASLYMHSERFRLFALEESSFECIGVKNHVK
jgi:hypothetical protein